MNMLKYLSILPSTFVTAKRKLLWPAAVILLLLHGNVYATCYTTGQGDAFVAGIDTTSAIPANAPVGTALGSWTVSYATGSVTCSPAAQVQATVNSANATPVGNYTEAGQTYTVFSTNVPSIGYVWGAAVYTSAGQSAWLPVNTASSITTFNGTASSILNVVRFRFVTTGSLTPGRYTLNNLNNIGTTDLNIPGNSPGPAGLTQSLNVQGSGGNTIVIPTLTCSLSTSSATFNMGTLATTAFTGGAGTTYGWVGDQALVSGGCNASTVSMTFAGTAAAAPYTSAFANSGGTAQGVAMELWQSSGAQAIPNGGALTFAPMGQNGDGHYLFSARYIQTAPAVTTGSVSATVTVTVNYQ